MACALKLLRHVYVGSIGTHPMMHTTQWSYVPATQLLVGRGPDIARSDCPTSTFGQRCRVLPVNVPSDSVLDFRSLAALPVNLVACLVNN